MISVEDDYIYDTITTETGELKAIIGNVRKIILTSDKASIKADGIDSCQLIATLYKFDGTDWLQEQAGGVNVKFAINGAEITQQTNVQGVATTVFSSSEVGMFLATASANNYTLGNLEVVVNAA